jgi:hypothetical protein
MTESSALLMNSLLGAIAVLLLLGLWIGARAVSRLGRIERVLSEGRKPVESGSETASPGSESAAESADGAFARFLEQYPDCRDLSKSEQSRAYRKWRKQQGLNWVSR